MYFLYFDPSMGAMLVQAIVAAVAGVVLFSKNLMFKIKSFFGLVQDNDDVFDSIEVEKSDLESRDTNDK